MLLGDGRRLLSKERIAAEVWRDDDGVIPIHEDFRVWVLANRPGFPFLGNNFFKEVGDVFSLFTIENPDLESEVQLLSQYAPSLSQEGESKLSRTTLRQLAAAFSELRALHHEGRIAYPYSIREAVAVVRHVEDFPEDGVLRALENVLGFDGFDRKLRASIASVFQKHGIPLSEDPTGVVEPVIELTLPKPIQV